MGKERATGESLELKNAGVRNERDKKVLTWNHGSFIYQVESKQNKQNTIRLKVTRHNTTILNDWTLDKKIVVRGCFTRTQ